MTARLLRCIGVAAAALLVALPAAALAASRTATCTGSTQRCSATFPLSGTKTGDRLVVRLPDTDLQLRSIVPSSPSLTSVYGFGGFSMRQGGSVFRAKLIVLDRIPAQASVSFTFAVPPRMRSCGDYSFEIDGSPIRLGDLEAHRVSCKAARRLANHCVSATGPGAGWTIFAVDRSITLQRRTQRVSFDLLNVNASCAPSG